MSSPVETLRKRFLEDVEKNPNLYHKIDIERVKTEEWQVRRFLEEFNGDIDKAYELLIKAMRWKKEFGIHERDDQHFPKELWELTCADVCGRDRKGRYIQLEVIRNQTHWKELHLIDRQFLVHNLERLDRMSGETGFVLLMDINGAGVSNVNMDLTKFKMQVIELYPQALKQMFVVDMPWLLSPIMKAIVSLMSPKLKEILIYVKRNQLTEHIDPQYIPADLDGKRDKPEFPSDLVPFDQCYGRLGVEEDFIKRFYKYHKLERTN